MKIYKIAQVLPQISIDISQFINSTKERIDSLITFSQEEQQRLTGFQFNHKVVLDTFRNVGYPNVGSIEQLIRNQDFSQVHEVLMDVYKWFKIEREKDNTLWDKISPAIKALNDYETISSGNNSVWTEEYGQKKLQELANQTEENMKKIVEIIEKSISNIPQWNGSSISIIANELYKDNDLEPETDAIIEVGKQEAWGGTPNFSLFIVEDGKIIIDDVLEGGDDDFFTNNNVQSDYFNLINSIRNPNVLKQPKVLTLYTARPSEDRQIYNNATEIPINIFLTSQYNFAEGFAIDTERDVWKIRILDKYLVKTMDYPGHQQYQTVGNKTVPVVSTILLVSAKEFKK